MTFDLASHITEVEDLLHSAGIEHYWLHVPGQPSYPYVLLSARARKAHEEQTCGGSDEAQDIPVRVTMVVAHASVLLTFVSRVQDVLDKASIRPSGHAGDLMWAASSDPIVDTSVTIPGTPNHPVYAVDTYRLVSTPA